MSSTVERVVRLANVVMRSLGRGHREAVYGRALSTALNHERVVHRMQVNCPIQFQNECVGFGIADLIVDDCILELKVLARIPTSVSDQVQKYIESLYEIEGRLYSGLVLNFNSVSGKVDVVRSGATPRASSHKRRENPAPPKRSRSPPSRRSPLPTTPNPISGKVDMVVEGGIPRAPSHKRRETPSPPKRSRSPPHRRSPSPTTPIHKRVVISRYFGVETRSAAGSRASSRSPSPTGSVLWGRCSTRSKSVF